MTMANGNLPASALATVPGQPAGSRLRVDACVSWVRFAAEVRARHGWTPTFTSAADAYRVYAIQERIFRQRYRTYATGIDPRGWDSDGDGAKETWWRLAPFAAAAVPGTSNHGLGVAVDITGLGGFTGTRYRQLAAIAVRHGWDNNEGRPIGEAWHWVYKPERDTHPVTTPGTTTPVLNIPTVGGALPTPLEEDDMPSAREVAVEILSYVPPGAPEGTPDVYGLITAAASNAASAHRAIVGADASEAARDAEGDERAQATLEQTTSGRLDFLRADPVTRAQLTELVDLVRSIKEA